jgi:hypothetical protein
MLVHDVPMVCDAARGSCGPDLEGATAQSSRTRAFVSSKASRYGTGGMYIYFDLPRPEGLVAVVELDFPTGNGVGGPAGGPWLSYREYRGEQLVFRSERATGRIEAPWAGCDCQDGRLELLFTDAGPDGALDTADDKVRWLGSARFGRGQGGAFCRPAQRLAVPERPGEVEIVALVDCPVTRTGGGGSSGGGGGGGGSYEAGGGCYVEDDDGYYDDDSGCDYDDGGDSYGSDDSGCEGDSSGGDWSDSSGGCEGDSSGGDWSDGGGCEGDSSDASCEGDAYASARPRRRRRSQRDRALGMLLPFVAFGLVHGWSRRRGRRAGLSEGAAPEGATEPPPRPA